MGLINDNGFLQTFASGGGGGGLALDGFGVSGAGSGSSQTVVLTTLSSNDVICIVAEMNASGQTLNSITGGSLTFTRRAQNTAGANRLELWTAIAASPLTGVTFTLNYSGSVTYTTCTAFGISGANTASPFDPNGGLPVLGTTDPLSITTSNANDFIIGAFRGDTEITTAGAGYTLISGVDFLTVEYKIVSTTQSGLSVTKTVGAGDTNGSIADAITAD